MNSYTEHSLKTLDFHKVLSVVAEKASTYYGDRHVLTLCPGIFTDSLEEEFDRIDTIVASLQRGEELEFYGIRNIDESLLRSKTPGTFLEPAALIDIANLSASANRLKKYLESHEEYFSSLESIVIQLRPASNLEKEIFKTIESNSFEVKDNASSALNKIRKEITSTSSKIRSKLNSLVNQYKTKGWLLDSEYSIHDDRYVLAVQSQHRGKLQGIVHGYSSSGGTVYIEPVELVELSNEVRHLQERENEEIRRILIELTDRVREDTPDLLSTVYAVSQLDSLQARARYAVTHKAFRPNVNSDDLVLSEAHHPLLLLIKGAEDSVPLTLKLDPKSRVLVITGPNAGGKTVALKTAGLITTMVHSGIIPPIGEDSSIPPIDSWHVIIGDDQSIESDLSSFSGHLTRLKEIEEDPSSNKLILIDEIASGTDPEEGAALSMALLEQAAQHSWWTIVTTHIGSLKAFAHRTDGVRNGSMQFNRETLSPSYRFMPDLPGSSYALEIAERVGLSRETIERATELIGDERQRLEDLIEELAERLDETDKLRGELAERQMKTAGMEKLLKERLEVLESEKKKLKGKAVSEAEEVLRKANKAVEHAVKMIREEQASPIAIREAHKIINDQKDEVESIVREMVPRKRKHDVKKDIVKDKHQAQDTPIEKGDTVILENGEHAEVLALQGNRIQVAVGSIKIWLDKSKIRKVPPKPANNKGSVKVHKVLDDEDTPVKMEIDLRGMRYEEAESILTKYLDDLSVSALPGARIIHGKGTGALRNLVKKMLNENPNITGSRDGRPEEGGFGVTIIEMK
ncbi:MAG: endonuclease MutS2 [Candidatus Electryonea clarkiae]|nr:endonuclease MutS2 [Candidatus Electryonea clarkiae]MDP8286953.1 endonuclease MutS2 [Candidatus Electryonea clarkiae]